jgi:hypothetical protein
VISSISDISLCLRISPSLLVRLKCPVQTGARSGSAIKARHVSKKNPHGWYRTIDYAELTTVPKLLIPDIKGEAHVVYEPGKLYPHHNLYFVTAAEWDLSALQAVLLSDVTRMFIT